MAVKILDVVVTTADEEVSWDGLKQKYTNWSEVSRLADWKDVRRIGTESPLTVTVGTPIKITISAVDITWDYIANNYQDWSAVKTGFTNWKSILNH